jgi:hypothetical protein
MIYTNMKKFFEFMVESSSKHNQFGEIEDLLLSISDRSIVINHEFDLKNFTVTSEPNYVFLSCYFEFKDSYTTIDGIESYVKDLNEKIFVINELKTTCKRLDQLKYKWSITFENKNTVFLKVFYKDNKMHVADAFIYNPEDSNEIFDRALLERILVDDYQLELYDIQYKLPDYYDVIYSLDINNNTDQDGKQVDKLISDLKSYKHSGKYIFSDFEKEIISFMGADHGSKFHIKFSFTHE